jgi:predicted O-linked N-acetylglucosamine transferase (SPINDLY family)
MTTSIAEYDALALDLARNPERLRRLRSKPRTQSLTCALFDTPRYARHLETSFDDAGSRRGGLRRGFRG